MTRGRGKSVPFTPASPASRARRKAREAASDLAFKSAPLCPQCNVTRLILRREREVVLCSRCEFDKLAIGPDE